MLTAVYEGSQLAAVRASALQGRLATSPDDAVELMVKALTSDNTLEQQLAIGHVRALKADGIASLIEKLPSTPTTGQAGLLLALGTSRVKAALPAIEKACHSDDPVLKIAAITALGHVGSAANTRSCECTQRQAPRFAVLAFCCRTNRWQSGQRFDRRQDRQHFSSGKRCSHHRTL